MALFAGKGFKKITEFRLQHPLLVIGGAAAQDFFGGEELGDLQQMVDDTLSSLAKKRYLSCPTAQTRADANIVLKAAGSSDKASRVEVVWGLHQPQPGGAVVGGGAINPGTHQHFTVSYNHASWHMYLPDGHGKRRNIVGLSNGPLPADFVAIDNV